MGATKRCAEHIVRHAALTHGVNYVAVRFGNVLGSQGSVVPTFLEQIRKGGPVTVTHPEMRRYFMTIPEAVQLVMQAGAMGKGGELFVLDMGEPVKIVDLATDLIRLSGLEPGSDIQIRFSGLRPGEKMYEELFFSHEQATPTGHPKILCGRDPVRPSAIDKIDELVALTLTDSVTEEELRRRLVEIVPDFVQQPHIATPPGGTPSLGMPVVPVEDTAPVYRSPSGKTRRISKEKALGAIMPRSPDIDS
jgi:FlaA1/EpsC-like NDP-sugar epimerase